MHLVTNVDNEGVGDRIDGEPVAIDGAKDLQSRDITLQKNSYQIRISMCRQSMLSLAGDKGDSSS